jgi:hypothetical protein
LLCFDSCCLASNASDEERTEKGVWIEGELGPVWQSRNEVEIPVDKGTRFSLTELGRGPKFSSRFYVGYSFNERHQIRGLWAPLSLSFQGEFDEEVSFQNEIVTASTATQSTYRFNSYRLTYRYGVLTDRPWSVFLGVTAKIRDAEIRLEQEGVDASRTNVGFVPLLSFLVSYEFSPKLELVLDGDALAAPQGRAEDVALLLGYRFKPDLQLRAGYRTLEGGASGGGNVYNFSWFHYAKFGVRLDF